MICLCHNHANYVVEAIDSVINQTYTSWELIVVDVASTDDSLWRVEQYKLKNPDVSFKTLFLGENIGNCRAFNRAMMLTNADYIIDLAADDILLPQRLEMGVKHMNVLPEVAINFSNANYIDHENNILKSHYPVGATGKSSVYVPDGDVFEEVIRSYFICSPTMMYRASYLKNLGGYDETLAYEDFDIKIRMAQQYQFAFTDKILVHKRILPNAMSTKQYKKGDRQLASTLAICYKILALINTNSQKRALLMRIAFESKQALLNFRLLLFLKFLYLGFKTIVKS